VKINGTAIVWRLFLEKNGVRTKIIALLLLPIGFFSFTLPFEKMIEQIK